MSAFEPVAREIVREEVRALLATGPQVDLGALADRVPARVALRFLGMPDHLADRLVEVEPGVVDQASELGREFLRFHREIAHEVIVLRRREPLDPATDLVSALVDSEHDGVAVSEQLVADLLQGLLGAARITTAGAISGTLARVATSPELQQRLREDPAAIPAAVEESLRMHPSLPDSARTATQEVVVGGRVLPAGSRVSLLWASANRDDTVFTEPDRFDVDREHSPHLTFGFGVHRCVGAPLARLEIRLAVEEVLAATSHLSAACPFEQLQGPPFPVPSTLAVPVRWRA